MSGIAKLKQDAGVRGIAHGVIDTLVDDFNRPAWRAGFAVAMVSTVVLARMGARAGITVFVSAMLGATAEQFYGMAEEISEKLGDHADSAP